ncbi:MAG TPA: NADH-quinone oxidoreductase subunit H [Candidatus Acidoferrales bacterium]|nr:NADH-quinone oxidoreductase subunit H [Candidatus Acidoferrales bacterium]
MTQSIALNLVQLAFVLGLSPLFAGVLARCKEIVQSKRGPSILQPYRDLYKLIGKEERLPEQSSWIFRTTPYLVFATPLVVTLLIPVLTDFPLFFAFAGDMLAVGFIFAISGFFFALAAIDAGNPYGAMGASRTRMVGFLAEPVLIIVLFTVSFVASSTIPYIVQQHWVHPVSNLFAPSHVLLLVAFFMIILTETGRLPVDNPSGHFELAMIDESKALEFSGRSAALVKYGGYMKFVVLAVVFLNVLTTPWGLANDAALLSILAAIGFVALKILVLVALIVIVESSYAKLRLFRIADFLAGAFVVSVTAMLAELLHL